MVDRKREYKSFLRYSNEKTTIRSKPSIKQGKIEKCDNDDSTSNEGPESENNSEEEEENLEIQITKPNSKMRNKPPKN